MPRKTTINVMTDIDKTEVLLERSKDPIVMLAAVKNVTSDTYILRRIAYHQAAYHELGDYSMNSCGMLNPHAIKYVKIIIKDEDGDLACVQKTTDEFETLLSA